MRALTMDTLQMRNIFELSQYGTLKQKKLLEKLCTLFIKSDLEIFCREFFHHIYFPMAIRKRETAVESTLDFISKFVAAVSGFHSTVDKENEQSEISIPDQCDEGGKELLRRLLIHIIHHHNRTDGVRYSCCRLLHRLLEHMSDDAEIEEGIFLQICEAMQERLTDSVPAIRVQAACALTRFQNPEDPDCPVISMLIEALSDDSPDVRKAALSTVVICRRTIPCVIRRTRDESDHVSSLSYDIISRKIHIKALTISDRNQILKDGLSHTSASVRETCSKKLLQEWLLTCKGRIIDLLQYLDVEMYPEVCKMALKHLFVGSTLTELVENFTLLNDKHLIDVNDISSESAFYWSNYAEYIHSLLPDTEDIFECLLPDCFTFCTYLLSYIESMDKVSGTSDESEESLFLQIKQNFICQQLLQMTSLFELGDLATSKCLRELYRDVLIHSSISHQLVKYIVPHAVKLFQKPAENVMYFSEIISEIREPTTIATVVKDHEEQKKIELEDAATRVRINEVQEEITEAVDRQDYLLADELKETMLSLEQKRVQLAELLLPSTEEIQTEKTDPDSTLKCLSIICQILTEIRFHSIDSAVRSLMDLLVLPSIMCPEWEIQNLAVRCLGIFCVISKDVARQYIHIFTQIDKVEEESIRTTMLKAIFNILLAHGPSILQLDTGVREGGDAERNDDCSSQNGGSLTLSELMCSIVTLLDNESSDIRAVAAEGLAKLMMTGRVSTPELFSRLVVLWYNPLSKDDLRICQCLASFFQAFARIKQSNQEIIRDALPITLTTLFKAPVSSPLSTVNIDHVCECFIGLTSARCLADLSKRPTKFKDHTIHNEMALMLTVRILSAPDSTNVQFIARTLLLLDLNPDSSQQMKDLQNLVSQALESVRNKSSQKMLKKFYDRVSSLVSEEEIDDNGGESPHMESPESTETVPA